MVLVPDSDPPPEGFATIVQSVPETGLAAACAPSQGLLGPGVGGGIAVRGYLLFLVDLPGVLADGPPAHFVRKVVGRAALDAARAGPKLSQALDVPMAKKSLIIGHSMGGYATMSAATEYANGYAAELDVRGFAAAAPVGDLRKAINDGIFNTVDGPVISIVSFFSWQRFYNLRSPPFVIEPFFSELATTILGDCFTTSGGMTGTLWDAYPKDPALVVTSTFISMATNDTWIDTWAAVFAENTAIPAAEVGPIIIFQGLADVTVTAEATEFYVDKLRAAGLTIDYRTYPTAEHRSTAFGPLNEVQAAGDDSFAWIRARLAD